MWIDMLVLFLFGVFTGMIIILIGIWYILSFFFHDPDLNLKQLNKGYNTQSTFQLPPVLLSKISDESCKSNESCWAVNFILYFLFRELKNSEPVRRWVLRKLAMEFDELLTTSVLGKFFSNINIQNIDLGQNFPVVNWVRTTKVELHPVFKNIATLDLLVDLDYQGGFQFSIQAETHLKHSAYLSVQFNEVKGQARLQFSTEPYAHWSFSFTENPEIDIQVVSQLYGKSFSQVTSIIAAQLKRSVRKKHTLPMYKIRYKPFFSRIENALVALQPSWAQKADTIGTLTLGILECRGLMENLLLGNVYATVGVAEFDWIAAYTSSVDMNQIFIVRDLPYVKTAKREDKLDFTLVQKGDVPVVDTLNTSLISVPRAIMGAIRGASFSPTDCILEPEDEIISVDGKRVSSVRQCIKNFKNSSSLRIIWTVRRSYTSAIESEEQDACIEELRQRLGGNDTPGLKNEDKEESFTPMSSRKNSYTGLNELLQKKDNESLSSKTSNRKKIRIYKTVPLPASKDPFFQDSFDLDIESSQRYLNVTLWTSPFEGSDTSVSPDTSPSGTPRKGKGNPYPEDPLPFGTSKVLGYLSIPLTDVITECSTTGMGYYVKDFYLRPPDISASAAKEHRLKNYSGFEPNMCYGKITLSFQFKTSEDQKRKSSDQSESATNPFLNLDFSGANNSVDPNLGSPVDEPGSHRFIRSHFSSVAVCDYCNRKIWLKEAYMCTICQMKCHKKCNERCLANTVCRGMWSRIPDGPPGGAPEIITTESETLEINGMAGELGADSSSGVSETESSLNMIGVRRKTLGGLFSAVQNRTMQLKRAGSANTLIPPSNPSTTSSKSLPPSPQASPVTSRKTSVSASSSVDLEKETNPFKSLDPTCSADFTQDNLNSTIENLIQRKDEDLVSMAKESGQSLYENVEPEERQRRLMRALARLQEEIDTITNEQKELSRSELQESSQTTKTMIGFKITRCDEKVQALALLMLHYCSGLQNLQNAEHKESESETPKKSESVGENLQSMKRNSKNLA